MPFVAAAMARAFNASPIAPDVIDADGADGADGTEGGAVADAGATASAGDTRAASDAPVAALPAPGKAATFAEPVRSAEKVQ